MVKFEGYKVLISFKDIEKKSEKEVHGINIPKNERTCIFCGADDAKFTKVAHAVSETVGNKSLISHLECDKCNENFGKMFEDSLGKYMLPYKIITEIFGKSKQLVSKDLSKDQESLCNSFRIQVNKNEPVIDGYKAKSLIIEKKDTGIIKKVKDGIEITIPRQHYYPPAVYCAFLKMAYSIMPLKYYEQYVKQIFVLKELALKNSIYNDEEKKKIMESKQNCGLFFFFPGINPLGGVNAILWEKVDFEESYPKILFTLEMKNFSFTIPVITDLEQEDYKMPKFSSDKEMQYGALDFKKEEIEFKCLMNANIIELEDYTLIEEKLKSLKDRKKNKK
ncbi:HNH endonuclease [Clostridium perfringens]|uniref:HNH endonuclease n=1 Tax=Clostridium perfringens TaxID=1502 RepID=UPI0039EAA6CB